MAIAEFFHVSQEEWEIDRNDDSMELQQIPLPGRSTSGSAGYDFTLPFQVALQPHESIIIPTGIRCRISSGWVLMLFPRSSLGYKFGMYLANTVGIIDSDYYFGKNEGHIMVKITAGDVPLFLKAGDRFCQGVFLQYGTAVEEEPSQLRTGGFGSTGN